MSSYYYITDKGTSFVESTGMIRDGDHVELNQLEHFITRMIVAGYTQPQIQEATQRVFKLIEVMSESGR